jgi:hypothetical protein
VEVSGAAPLVETSTASVGTVIGQQQVVELPLNARRFGNMATLVPGTVSDNGGFANSVYGSAFSEETYNANGARSASNNILIDGVDSKNLYLGGFSVQPSPDAVQEFKIQTSIYSAAFGKTAGSTINLVTKSGTNELHGTAYEFLRNDKLDARNFFALDQTNPVTGVVLPGTARPEYRRNQFGFAIGGPIRKNKTFFFANYEPLREIRGESATGSVPTDAEKRGDFSSFLTGQTINLCGSGGPANLNVDGGQLFDPATLSRLTCPVGSASAGATILVGTAVPGNVIANIDPVAQKVVAQWPEPNLPGSPNFIFNGPRIRNDHQIDIRIDHTFSERDQVFGRYLLGQSHISDPTFGYTAIGTFGQRVVFRGQDFALGWTHTLGSHLLNEFRLGFDRNWNPVYCAKCPRALGFIEGFGINGLRAASPGDEGFPFFSFSNFEGVGDVGYTPNIGPHMLEKYQDNLTWTHGRHTVVVGADVQFWQSLHAESPVSPHGQFTFNGQFSGLAGEIPNVGGISDLADLELGYPSGALRSFTSLVLNQVGGTFWSYYGQDDFKISPNLTLNIGLRYEYRRPPVDKRDYNVTFAPVGPKFSGPGNALLVTAADDATNDALCANNAYLLSATGQCLVASSSQRAQLGFTGRTRRSLIFTDKKDFAPRIGLSWRPTSSDKLVVRAGAGVFYDLNNFNNLQFVENNPVFEPSQIYNTTFGGPPPVLSGTPVTTQNAFLAAGLPSITSSFASLYAASNYKAPRVGEWSFGFESQLARDWALEVNYIGSHGVHQGNLHLFANQPLPGVGDLQPRRPYPDFNIILYTSPDADTSYNSLQTKLTKRFSNGITFLASYTWAKSISDNEGDEGFSGGVGNSAPQDDNNLRLDRARAYSDARQRFVLSSVWQLPVGHGQRFLNTQGWVDRILGGWEFSGIVTFQSGFPISILSSQDFSNTGTLNARPDRTCGGVGKKTIDSWFDASCFTVASLEQALTNGTPRFGNSGRNVLDGPGLNNWDLALLKNIKISERFKLQFRSEFFNGFNFAQFGSPNTVCSGVGTGGTCAGVQGSNIGKIFGAGSPRDIQFGLKLSF